MSALQLKIEDLFLGEQSPLPAQPQPSLLTDAQQKPLYFLPLSEIVIDEQFNRREEWGDLTRLGESIEISGAVPGVLSVFWSGEALYLTDGFRRLSALRLLHEQGRCLTIQSAWAMLEDVSDCHSNRERLAALMATQITANQGLNFSPYEQAKIFYDMESRGVDRARISALCGVSLSTISERLRLLLALPETVEFVRDQGIADTRIIQASRRADTPEEIDQIIREAASSAAQENRKPSRQDVADAASRVLTPKAAQLEALAPEDTGRMSVLGLHEQGYSMTDIQKKLGIAWSSINRIVSGHRREHQFDWLNEHGLSAERPPMEYYTNYDWARESCGLSREAASKLLGIGADAIEAVETLQKKPTEQAIRRMTVIYGRWLPGLSADHLLGIKDFKSFLSDLHEQSVVSRASWN